MIRITLPALLLFGASPALSAPSHDRVEISIDADVAKCRKDPRFRIGGAAMGDCLMELSDQQDKQIESKIIAGEARYCYNEDKLDYRQIQAEWLQYRKRMCDLVERSPGNTPAWVNSAACRLQLGRQRLASLIYTDHYGSPACPVNQSPSRK